MENETYEQFVRSRVKWLSGFQADFLHAAVGILGELIEFKASVGRDHGLEELADIEFYLVHMQIAANDYAGHPDFHLDRTWHREVAGWDFTSAINDAITCAGNLLDYAKKMWVYNKPPKELIDDIVNDFQELLTNLNTIHQFMGTSCGVLRANNEAKLRIRYPRGYTDTHAQARLDKSPDL